MRLRLLLLGALLLSACTRPPAAGDADAQVMARVGDSTITVTEFVDEMRARFGPAVDSLLAQGQTPEQIQQIAVQENAQQGLFDDLVLRELVLQEGRRAGVTVDIGAIDAQIDAVEAGPVPESTPLAIEQRIQRRADLIAEETFRAMVVQHTTYDRYRARHILVQTREDADAVLARLAQGADFAALAQELSQDTGSAAQGGDLGLRVNGEFVPEFEQAALAAELNTPVVAQSQFGFHVIEVLERERDLRFGSWDELAGNPAAQQLFETRFLPWYDQLRQQAEADGRLQILVDPASIPVPIATTPAPAP